MSSIEEKQILKTISELQLSNFQFRGFTAKRRVAAFGYSYSFNTFQIKKVEEIPEHFRPLRRSVARFLNIEEAELATMLVTEYAPTARIGWHKDAQPFGLVAGISLLNHCDLILRQGERRLKFLLEPRSLYVLKNSARDEWEHSINPVEKLRYSITFRSLRNEVLKNLSHMVR